MFQKQLTFQEAVQRALTVNYCNFSGRSSRSEYWWHHRRPLILNELAVFYSSIPLRVTTKVTTPTLIRCNIVRYACHGKHISFRAVA